MLTIVLVYRDEQGKKNQYQNCTFYFFDHIINNLMTNIWI